MPSLKAFLPDVVSGEEIAAYDIMLIVNAIRELQQYVGDNTKQQGSESTNYVPVVETFLAKTKSSPCSGAGFTPPDCRYFLDRIVADPTLSTTQGSESILSVQTAPVVIQECFCATNLAELVANNGGGPSHMVPVGTVVQVFAAYLVGGATKKFYWFDHVSLDGITLRADLTQDGGTAGDVSTLCTFTYTAKYLGTTNVISTAMSPEASFARVFKCTATAATKGLVYWHSGTPTLTIAYETSGNKSCT